MLAETGEIFVLHLYLHIHEYFPHILLVVCQYSYMGITLSAITGVPQQTTRHLENIHYSAGSARVAPPLYNY